MLIYPAIDLQDGRCVRLAQGRFDAATIYDADPFARLGRFAADGARWTHIVDLDGAKKGAAVQHQLIGALASKHPVRIQAGGGIRTREDVARLLTQGVARAVVGSAAVKDSAGVHAWIAEFGIDAVCLAFDVKLQDGQWMVAVHGWKDTSGLSLDGALGLFPAATARHILVTDVSRDGMMTGPNGDLIRDIAAKRPDLQVQASGGVARLADLADLKKAGSAGAIVGRALYEGAFTLKEALGAG